MKTKILLFSLLFSGATFLASAQDNAPQRQRGEKPKFTKEQMQARADSVRAARTAFIAGKAGLTEAEQAKFLPLYQEYQAKLREARQASMQAMSTARQNKAAVDPAQALNDMVNLRMRQAELLKEYAAKFNQVLPAEKVWKVFQSERQFTQKAMKRGGKNSPTRFGGESRKGCQHPQTNASK